MLESGLVRVLLVEDDEVDRLAVQRLFAKESLPYDLVVASTVAEATSRLREGGIGLVLVDHKLPDGCGLDVQKEAAETPSIFITGADDVSVAVEAMKAGAADFLVKDSGRQYLQLLPLTIESALKQEEHIRARRRAEEALQKSHDELEVQVRGRTAELASTVDRLNREIEERKRAEETLHRSQTFLQSVIDAIPEITLVIDRDYRVVLANRAARKKAEDTDPVAARLTCYQLSHEYETPCQKDIEPCPLEQIMATKRPVTVEHTHYDADNNEFYVEISAAPIFDEAGEVVQIVEASRNITDRKRAETALRQSEERFRTVVEASKDGMVAINREGLITVFNPAAEEMFGHEEQNILGEPVDCLMPEEYREQHRQGRQGYFTSGEPSTFIGKTVDLPALRSDGHVFPVELSLSAARIGGEPFVLATIRDITERTVATRALQSRVRQQEVVVELGRYALMSDDLTDVMNEVVRRLAETIDVEFCKVLELLPDGRALLLRAGVGWKEGLAGRATVPAGQDSQAGYTLLSDQPVVVEDLRTETRFSGPPLLHDHNVVSGMSVVIQGPKRPWGVLGAHSTQPKIFSNDDVNFLQAVANLLADAIARKRVEEELAASETNHREVFNAVNDIIIVHDKDTGAVLDVNETYCRVFGFTRDEARQLTTGDFSLGKPPCTQEDSARWARKAIDEGPQLFEWVCKKKSGEPFWAEVNLKLAVIGGEDRVLAVVRDISERKQAEETLRETRDYLENLLDYANAPVIAWDPAFRITRFNHAFERLAGYTADEMIGRQLQILFPDESRSESLGKIERTASGEYWESVEIPILRKDGDVRLALWNSANLYTDDQTTLLATIAQGQDITDRKQAEETLRETRDYLENLLDYANAPVIVWDPAFRITRFNHAFERLAGYMADEMIGRQLQILFPDESRSESLGKIERTASGEYWESVEIPILRKDGDVRLALWNSANLYADDQTTLLATIAQGQDITDRKQAEKEREGLIMKLEAQNAELERFTYTVSHDLKSPLITLKGYMGVLKEDLAAGDGEAVEDDVTRMASAADKMGQLLDELLELSRVGRVVNPPDDVALGEIAGEAVSLVSGRIARTRVRVEIAPDLPVVFADRSRLVEVLQNLIDNALKHIGDQQQPRIEIGVRQDDGETVCYVRDNGMGIDPRHHEKVFGLFEKLDPKSEGTGVGLALVKRIIEVHGGRIWVESEGKARGSTFCFTLPQRTDSTKREEIAK